MTKVKKLNPDRTNFNPELKKLSEADFKKHFESVYAGDYKKYYSLIKAGKHNVWNDSQK